MDSQLLLLLLLTLVMPILLVPPVFSTSRGVLLDVSPYKDGLRITLQRVDSAKNLTKFERLQRALTRTKHRLNRLSSAILPSSPSSELVNSQIHAGKGEFLMKLSIGSPPESFTAIMDTGSDLIWTQCEPCKKCFNQTNPIFDPKKSSSFANIPCSNKLCKALPTSSCDNDTGGSNCEYLYSYGDSSSTFGFLATETFTFGKVSVPKIGFGCGEENEGSGFTQGSGLVGLGRGYLSLVSQLSEPKFSYCLTSIDDTKTSALLMGSLADINGTATNESQIIRTPLIQNPVQPSFYYISLKGITVGSKRLPIDKSAFELRGDGSGGIIVDSGTTITYLEDGAFKVVKNEFVSQTKLPVDDSGSTGLDLCFKLPSRGGGGGDIELPSLTLHFDGGDMKLPGANYMIADERVGLVCLAMGSSNGMSIFGNVQQQNMLVVHDLVKETVSFVPTKCDQL